MPATFPSHAAAALPLKLVRPRWFDAVALVVGSTAPDLSYPLHPMGWVLFTHQWTSLLWWTLPVTMVLCAAIRWVAPYVAVNLPGWRWFALRDYGAIGRGPAWWITASSAILGGATHIFWDGFTHPAEGGAWFVVAVPVMSETGPFGEPWWNITQWVSTTVGAVAVVLVAVHIGRRRLVREWHGEPPQGISANLPVFWAVTAIVGAAGTAATYADPQLIYVQGVRLLLAWSVALIAGGLASSGRRRTGDQDRRTGDQDHPAGDQDRLGRTLAEGG